MSVVESLTTGGRSSRTPAGRRRRGRAGGHGAPLPPLDDRLLSRRTPARRARARHFLGEPRSESTRKSCSGRRSGSNLGKTAMGGVAGDGGVNFMLCGANLTRNGTPVLDVHFFFSCLASPLFLFAAVARRVSRGRRVVGVSYVSRCFGPMSMSVCPAPARILPAEQAVEKKSAWLEGYFVKKVEGGGGSIFPKM